MVIRFVRVRVQVRFYQVGRKGVFGGQPRDL